jgi:S1-C subfamily serine protease
VKINFLILLIIIYLFPINSFAYEEMFMPKIESTIYEISRTYKISGYRNTDKNRELTFVKEGLSRGLGYMISSDGKLLTANHVVRGESYLRERAKELKLKYGLAEINLLDYYYVIKDYRGTKYYATIGFRSLGGCLSQENVSYEKIVSPDSDIKILKESYENDLALLKLRVKRRPYLQLGVKSDLKNGEKFYALLPNYLNNRKVILQEMEKICKTNGINGSIMKLISTHKSVVRGSSGGPLLTYDGKAVGVVSGTKVRENITLSVPLQSIREFIR